MTRKDGKLIIGANVILVAIGILCLFWIYTHPALFFAYMIAHLFLIVFSIYIGRKRTKDDRNNWKP